MTDLREYWSLISLKEYFEQRLDAMEKAVGKADTSNEKRLEGMNEFRAQLKDQQQTFLTRSEYEAKHELLNSKIEVLTKLVYIGVGILLVVQIAIGVFLELLMK